VEKKSFLFIFNGFRKIQIKKLCESFEKDAVKAYERFESENSSIKY
jgi:hypothetical protein